MAALEWNADLYLPLVAYQAQAGPGLVQNSSARTTASLSLSLSQMTEQIRFVVGRIDVAARYVEVLGVASGQKSCQRNLLVPAAEE